MNRTILTSQMEGMHLQVPTDLFRCAPPLIAFTVCFWIKTADQAYDVFSFSYSLPDEDNEILVIIIRVSNSYLVVTGNKYHHLILVAPKIL